MGATAERRAIPRREPGGAGAQERPRQASHAERWAARAPRLRARAHSKARPSPEPPAERRAERSENGASGSHDKWQAD